MIDQYTKLLLHMDDSNFIDEIGHTITNNGTVLNAKTKKFGSGSAYFNGSSASLSVAYSSDFNFGANDFTVDWWEYKTVANTNQGTVFQVTNGTTGYSAMLLGYNDSSVYMSSNNTSWDIANGRTLGAVVLNQWQHLAVVRKGNTFYTFRNGIQQDTWTSSASLAISSIINIGKYNPAPVYYLTGYIDEFRISNTAIWTNNFTPNTVQYPCDKAVINTNSSLDIYKNVYVNKQNQLSYQITHPDILLGKTETNSVVSTTPSTLGNGKMFNLPIDQTKWANISNLNIK